MPGENIVQTYLSSNTRKIVDELAFKMGISKSKMARDLIHESLRARGHEIRESVDDRYRGEKPFGKPPKEKKH